MRLFFDEEFTGLHQQTTLISLGIVSEDGRYFYAEFVDYDKSQVSPWIQENIISQLHPLPNEGEDYSYLVSRTNDNKLGQSIFKSYNVEIQGTTSDIKRELFRWLNQFKEEILFVGDVCHYDLILLIDLLCGDALKLNDTQVIFDEPIQLNIVPCAYDINQDIAQYFNISLSEAFDRNRENLLYQIYGNNVNIEEEMKSMLGNNNKVKKHNALWDALVCKCIYTKLSK